MVTFLGLGNMAAFRFLIPYYMHPRQVGTRPVRADRPLCWSPLAHCGSMPLVTIFFRLNN